MGLLYHPKRKGNTEMKVTRIKIYNLVKEYKREG